VGPLSHADSGALTATLSWLVEVERDGRREHRPPDHSGRLRNQVGPVLILPLLDK
jgi:hypothetical protein